MKPPTFADRLRAIREAAGMTKYALAKSSGVDATYLGLLERGIKSPGWATACQLADALGVSVEAFRGK